MLFRFGGCDGGVSVCVFFCISGSSVKSCAACGEGVPFFCVLDDAEVEAKKKRNTNRKLYVACFGGCDVSVSFFFASVDRVSEIVRFLQ